jgi:hypothetical protein
MAITLVGLCGCGPGAVLPGAQDSGGTAPAPAADGGDAGPASGPDSGSDGGGAAPDGGQADAGPAVSFAAILSGDDESPPVTTGALGAAALSLSGTTLTYRITHSVPNGVAAEIRNSSGQVLFTLAPFGSAMTGTVTLGTQDAADLATGNLFVDVASRANPAGEIRGAISPGTSFHAALSGAAEVPPVTTAATGWSAFILNGSALSFHVVHDVATGTAAHLHAGAPTVAAGPLQVVFDYSSDISGQTTLTQAQVDDLTSGGLYVQVHSQANPGGEVRGQVGN